MWLILSFALPYLHVPQLARGNMSPLLIPVLNKVEAICIIIICELNFIATLVTSKKFQLPLVNV